MPVYIALLAFFLIMLVAKTYHPGRMLVRG